MYRSASSLSYKVSDYTQVSENRRGVQSADSDLLMPCVGSVSKWVPRPGPLNATSLNSLPCSLNIDSGQLLFDVW